MKEAVEYKDDVNLLANKLITVDDFNMSYENITTEIYDEEADRAQMLLDGEVIAKYVYGGPWFYPIEVNEDLLNEALEIMADIEVDM